MCGRVCYCVTARSRSRCCWRRRPARRCGFPGGARLNPFLYTLDLLVPIADFGQRSLWNPNALQHWIGSVIVVLGWSLAGIAFIGMARVFNRP